MEASLRRKSAHERMQQAMHLRELKHKELMEKTKKFKQKLKVKPLYKELEENFQKKEEDAVQKKKKILV
jgi:hypothetical protein